MSRASLSEFYQVLGDTLKVKPSTITDDSSPRTISAWDSMGSILVATALEHRFGVRLTLEELMTMNTVADLRAALGRHGVQFDA